MGIRSEKFRHLSQKGKPLPLKSVLTTRLMKFIVRENLTDAMISA